MGEIHLQTGARRLQLQTCLSQVLGVALSASVCVAVGSGGMATADSVPSEAEVSLSCTEHLAKLSS